MSAPLIAVLDYGIGNLRSAQKALQRVGADARLTADPELVRAADGVVLPGVGNFGRCMEALRAARLDAAALDAIASGRPFLGICVGMQMLFDGSDESPDVRGLGVVAGTVRWLPATVKRPQMQWNVLHVERPSWLFAGLGDEPWMYFVHSFHPVPVDAGAVVATCDYGGPVVAAIEQGNVVAVQFHPEKSARAGLGLLANWAEALVPA
ncbi:MAG TPA: imidazole glycerol phosphate synthase subunit HisH [Acidimicrobiales bacterium]